MNFWSDWAQLIIAAFQNDPQSAYSQVLVPAKVLEELGQDFFAEFAFPDEKGGNVDCEAEPPLGEFQEVFAVALQMPVQVATETFIFAKVSFADVDHVLNIRLLFESFYFE